MRKNINHIITSLGRRFNFDAHYFVKNTFWLLVGQAIVSFASFLLTVALANHVSKHDLGDYRLVISIYSTITFFALSGLAQALIRSIVIGKEGSLQVALALKKKYSILAGIIGIGFSLYFWYFKNNQIVGISILIAAICLPIIETYSIYNPYLQAKHEFRFSSIHTGIVKFVAALAVIVATYFVPTTIYLVIAFYFTQAIVTYLQYQYLIKKIPPKNNEVDTTVHSYAKHITAASALNLIFGQADKFILYHFFGPVALAQYWIAISLPQEAGRIIGTVAQVAYPRLIKGNHEEDKKKLPKNLLLFSLFSLTISILYSLTAHMFFAFFFPAYVGEATKSIVLMFALTVVPHWFIWQYFTAKGYVKIVYLGNSVEPILQIILYCMLIPFFGVWGLVYSILIKTILMNCFSLYILKRV